MTNLAWNLLMPCRQRSCLKNISLSHPSKTPLNFTVSIPELGDFLECILMALENKIVSFDFILVLFSSHSQLDRVHYDFILVPIRNWIEYNILLRLCDTFLVLVQDY